MRRENERCAILRKRAGGVRARLCACVHAILTIHTFSGRVSNASACKNIVESENPRAAGSRSALTRSLCALGVIRVSYLENSKEEFIKQQGETLERR